MAEDELEDPETVRPESKDDGKSDQATEDDAKASSALEKATSWVVMRIVGSIHGSSPE
ncbi:hypothetical protein Ate02nite_50060 [Paractinoplanes tereljensis]|uniref:Uncharacterized protein n=2 Tax=Paractinoplanes tereljensis TaxID=571912 RepID=A0A919NNS9_9ACTN|nr:hypothetical protein Ate02nite_50060 [Actinoplanes tereljensis]